MKNWKKGIGLLAGLALMAGTAGGCTGQAALEDRTYVESLHIIPEGEGYRYQCTLAYVDSNSAKYLKAGLDGAVMEPGSTEQEKEKKPENENNSGETTEEESGDYTAVADNMTEFNQEYYRLTGSNFDYSHLQGIYLDASLYQPKLAEAVLKDIREATQAVLSTPIYQEGLEIGEQQETTLGDWLKEGR
ncbi:MAG: hypothetical protein K2N24_07060 [Lachnospiraceae bacterium]|nr:hypothetical protein [Lachnospiraceae bacterium]